MIRRLEIIGLEEFCKYATAWPNADNDADSLSRYCVLYSLYSYCKSHTNLLGEMAPEPAEWAPEEMVEQFGVEHVVESFKTTAKSTEFPLSMALELMALRRESDEISDLMFLLSENSWKHPDLLAKIGQSIPDGFTKLIWRSTRKHVQVFFDFWTNRRRIYLKALRSNYDLPVSRLLLRLSGAIVDRQESDVNAWCELMDVADCSLSCLSDMKNVRAGESGSFSDDWLTKNSSQRFVDSLLLDQPAPLEVLASSVLAVANQEMMAMEGSGSSEEVDRL